MKVKELKQMMANLPDDVDVMIDSSEGGIYEPSESELEDIFVVTLVVMNEDGNYVRREEMDYESDAQEQSVFLFPMS